MKQVLEAKYTVSEKEIKIIGDLTHLGIQKGEFGDDFGITVSPFDALDRIKEEVEKAFNEKK